MRLIDSIISFFKRHDFLVIGIGNGGNNIVENVKKRINCSSDIVLLDTDEILLKEHSVKNSILLDNDNIKQKTAIEKLLTLKIKKTCFSFLFGWKYRKQYNSYCFTYSQR